MPDQTDGAAAEARKGAEQTQQAAGQRTQAGQSPGQDSSKPEGQQGFYLGTFKDRTEAEKGYKAAQAKITEVTTKLSQMESEIEGLKSKADMKEVLLALSQKEREASPAPTARDFDSFIEGIRSDLSEAPEQALRKLTGWQHALVEEERRTRGKEFESIQSELKNLKTELEETKERSDSFYQEHMEVIDDLVAGGMKVRQAKSFLKKFAQSMRPVESDKGGEPPIMPDDKRARIPPSTSEPYLSDEDKSRFKAEGMTDEQIAQMESEYKRRTSGK